MSKLNIQFFKDCTDMKIEWPYSFPPRLEERICSIDVHTGRGLLFKVVAICYCTGKDYEDDISIQIELVN